jgi:hypothetical protein
MSHQPDSRESSLAVPSPPVVSKDEKEKEKKVSCLGCREAKVRRACQERA